MAGLPYSQNIRNHLRGPMRRMVAGEDEGPVRLFQHSAADPLLESPVAGLVRRIFLRELTPPRSGAQHPEHAVQHQPGIMPWTAAIVLMPMQSEQRLHYGPLSVGQFPASCHRRVRRSQSSYEHGSKNRPQSAAGAGFCGGVKVVHRRTLDS